MCQASGNGKAGIPARSAVLGRRAFFVPTAKCQARVLECQALDLKTLGQRMLGGIIYWMSKLLVKGDR